jgi:hypothetical protein
VAYIDVVLGDSPAGYWRFDDAPGSATVHDYSGNSTHLQYTGVILGEPGLLPAEATTSARFDGGEIYAPSNRPLNTWAYAREPSGALELSGALTIECWVRFTEAVSTVDTYLVTLGEALWGGYNYQFGVWSGSPNYIFLQGNTSLFNNLYWDVQYVPPTDRAAHLVATYDGSFVRFYADGVKLAEYAETGVLLSNGVREGLYIGSDQWSDTALCTLAEMAIYGHALSDAGVLAHYRAGVGGPATGLTATASVIDAYGAAVLADLPDRYHRLGEAPAPEYDRLALADATGQMSSITSFNNGAGLMLPAAAPLVPSTSDRALRLLGQSNALLVGFDNRSYGSAFSVELWAALDSSTRACTLTQRAGSASFYSWKLAYDGAGGIVYGFASGGTAHTHTHAFTPTPGVPNHYVLTYDKTEGHLKLYIDGALARSDAETATADSGTYNLLIGGDYSQSGSAIVIGSVDEFAVYPAALSAARVAAHYSAAQVPGERVARFDVSLPLASSHPSTFFTLGASWGRSPVPGLVPHTWIRAEGQRYADGELVRTLADLSGNDLIYNTRADGVGPVYRTGRVGGKAALVFNGTGDYLEPLGTYLNGGTELEAFAVVKVDADPPASSTKTGLWAFSNPTSARTAYPDTDGSIKDGFGSTTQHLVGNPGPSLDQYRVYNVSSRAGEWRAALDGVELLLAGTNSVPGTLPGGGLLGRTGNTPFSYLDGEIADFIVFDRVLTTDERSAVLSELHEEYGLGSSILVWGAQILDSRVTVPLAAALGYDTIYSTEVLADAPVAYYHLDEAGGATTALDGSGHGNDAATVTDVTFGGAGAVRRSSSGHFNGTTSVIEAVPTNPASLSGSWSVELWVNFDGAGSFCGVSSRGPSDNSFDMQLSTTGGHMDIGSGSVWYTTSADWTASLTAGAWHHIVVVVSPPDLSWAAYADGTLAGSGVLDGSAVPLLYNSTHHLFIGRNAALGQSLLGFVDEVAIYDHALSPARIAAHSGARSTVAAGPRLALPVGPPSAPLTLGYNLAGISTADLTVAAVVAPPTGVLRWGYRLEVAHGAILTVTLPCVRVVTVPLTTAAVVAAGGSGGGAVGAGAPVATGLETGIVLPRPPGVGSGSFLVAAIAHASGLVAADSLPTGWTEWHRFRNAVGALTVTLYTKVAGGSEPSSYTFSFTKQVRKLGVALAYSGVATGSPEHASAAALGANSPMLTAPLVIARPNCRALAIYAQPARSAVAGPTAGWTERCAATTAAPFDNLTLYVQDRLASAGTLPPAGVVPDRNQRYASFVVAIAND